MDVFEAVRTLLAVRSYQGKPVPDAVVRRIVEAGRLTGSGMNRQPWHFIVVRDRETLRRLGTLASSGPYVAEAPLCVDGIKALVDGTSILGTPPLPPVLASAPHVQARAWLSSAAAMMTAQR